MATGDFVSHGSTAPRGREGEELDYEWTSVGENISAGESSVVAA
jgi:hypothetical protein